MEFIVDKPDELLMFLQKKMRDSSRTHLKEVLSHSVCVDGRKVTQYNYPLQEGMRVSVEKCGYKERYKPREIDIVYEDEYLMVINKHEGLLTYSKNTGDKTAITVVNWYLERTHQKCHAHVVHRLDRDTSGLLLVAKSKEVSRELEEDWKRNVYDRAYVAVVWGNVEENEGTIKSWFTDGEYCVLSSNEDNGGKLAVTHYKVVKRNGRYTLLEFRLDTGRRNQIRVHAREMRHPIVHDPMYGYKNDAAPISRLALHAFQLCFVHPVTRRKMEFKTPYPSNFMRLLENRPVKAQQ